MKLYSRQEAIARMNMLAGCSKSFVFLIDYSQEQVYVEETAEVSPEELIYNLNGFTNEAVAGLTDELFPERKLQNDSLPILYIKHGSYNIYPLKSDWFVPESGKLNS